LRNKRDPFAMQVRVSHDGIMRDIGIVPDFVFDIRFPDKSRRCFLEFNRRRAREKESYRSATPRSVG
jgi:hypothetical protein